MMMDMGRSISEKCLDLAIIEVRLACLLVDYRGRPAIVKKLEEQRVALLALRRRLEDVSQIGGIELNTDPSSS